VSMALMTWCGIVALGWVVIACLGAVIWERRALPTHAVPADPG
jgi:hypothetical protein